MRKLTISVIIVCMGLISQAQTTYFNNLIFPFKGANGPNAIVKMDSVYYVLTGNVDTGDWRQHLSLIILDTVGSILNSRLYQQPFTSYTTYPGNSLIVTSDSCLFICGAIMDTVGRINGYVMKIDRNLDTLWTRTYAHPDTVGASQPGADVFHVFTSVKQTMDGGFILTGNSNYIPVMGYKTGFLQKIDSIGNIEWSKGYGVNANLQRLEELPDQGFLFVNFNAGFYLVRTDKFGNVQWQKKPNNDIHYATAALRLTSNSYAVVASPYKYMEVQGTPLFGIDIYKIELNTQQIVWNKKYNLFHSFENKLIYQSFEMVVDHSDNIYICGTSVLSNPSPWIENSSKGVLLKLNSNGDSLWARWYGYGLFSDDNQFNDFIQTDDGGFLCVGWHEHPVTGVTYQNAWLVKLDSLGCDTPGCHTVGIQQLQLSNTELQIFPNPTTDYITIQTKDSSPLPQGTLQIFNMQGALQMVQAIPKYQNQLQLNLSYLPTGLYVGRIVSSSGEGGGFRFVKE